MSLIKKMKTQVPENLDYAGTAKIFSNDHSPLKVVLLQEIQRYNLLLDIIRNHLIDLEKGIQGLVVMSSELDDIFVAIYENHVPVQWQSVSGSSKPNPNRFLSRMLTYLIRVGLQLAPTAELMDS